jgi:hypothetical protein
MGARRLRLRRPSSERLTSPLTVSPRPAQTPVRTAVSRHLLAREEVTSAAAQEDLVKSPASCPKPVLSATALPPSPLYRENASTTRVHNQRRTTTGVTAFCDRHGHGTPARLRPRLRHRPATTSPGRCPRARGCYRVLPRPPAGPVPTAPPRARPRPAPTGGSQRWSNGFGGWSGVRLSRGRSRPMTRTACSTP